ncbi:hypothetical protein HO133_003572 [Letharia lupina]|uniref:Ankyrin repeat protein n=1 Tax=Letharia lupina TaxID=560253 RepID=A0A8H6CA51_9LECA|nr:uncharacterized protein HO133_003572 [Letharia lupina]KAF6219747.1 hypothetical protein HO133_003572 [Letharia lupina]
MDPVSIAAAVGPALKTLYSVTTTLYTFITSAKKVGKSLEDLQGEVRGLTRVLEDIEAFPKDTVIAQTSYASSRTDGAWDPIHNAIQDTQRTIEALQKVLDRLGPPSKVTNGFKKAVKQVQLNINSEEISNIRAINCRTNDNIFNVINPKIDTILPLVSKVEGLIKQVENLSSQWTTKDDKLPMDFRNPHIAGHTQQLKRTAEAVIASASTVIESQSTIVSGKDRQHPSSASSGELSEELRKCDIEEWITRLTVNYEEPRSESDSASELMPDDSVSSIGLNRRRRSQQINEAGMPGSTSETGKGPGPPKRMDNRRKTPTKDIFEEKLAHRKPNEKIKSVSIEEDLDLDIAFEQIPTGHRADPNVGTSYNKKSAKELVAALMMRFEAKKWNSNDALLELAKTAAGQGVGSRSDTEGALLYLLGKGANVNAIDANAKTALHHLSNGENTALIDLLVERNADINVKNEQGLTALHLAAVKGNTPVVEILLKSGVDIEQKSENALSLAASWGRAPTVDCLLKAGANIHAREGGNNTSLSLAALNGHTEVASMLVNAGSSVDAKNEFCSTPLSEAAFWGRTEVVEVLLRAGALVNVKDDKGNTPLHHAARSGYTGVVEVLLKAGASVNVKDNEGDTPLHDVIYWGRFEVVEVLLKAGASVNVKDNEGDTPLHHTVYRGYTGVVEVLLKAGAWVNMKDNKGITPLHDAVYWGHTGVVEVLLKAGASVNVKDDKGITPLHDAVYWGHTGVVEVLLKAGANLEAREDLGQTPLVLAAYWGHRTSIELLLAAGADKRARTNYGETVLHRSLCYAHPQDCNKEWCAICAESVTRKDIAKLLCERGADPSAKRNDGKSVLSWLREHHHVYPKSEQQVLIRVLKEYGAK